MTFEEHMQAAIADHAALVAQQRALEIANEQMMSLVDGLRVQVSMVEAKNRLLEARITELEGGGDGGDVDPPPTPTGNPPKILNDRLQVFDRDRYFLDKTNEEQVTHSPGKLGLSWAPKPAIMAGKDGKRAQVIIKEVYGGGGTPYRDPVGALRWYGLIFHADPSFPVTGTSSSSKCVPFQWHQGNGTPDFDIINPPVSAEIVNIGSDSNPESILRLCLSLPQLDPDRIYKSMGAVPKVPTRFIFRTNWQSGSGGSIDCWRDGVKLWAYNGPTCHSMDDAELGLAPFFCSYNPGAPSGSAKRTVFHGAILIGDETNTLADIEAALA